MKLIRFSMVGIVDKEMGMQIGRRMQSVLSICFVTLSLSLAVVVMLPASALALTDGWNLCGSCEWLVDGDVMYLRPEDNNTSGELHYDVNPENPADYWDWYPNNFLIKKIVITGDITATGSLHDIFNGFMGLEAIEGLANIDTSQVTDMSDMFYFCHSLTTIDLSNFDTSNVTDMSEMFWGCSSLKDLDVSGLDTSKVQSMRSMFSECRVLGSLDVSKFDTQLVSDMAYMFSGCGDLTSLDVSGFDTQNTFDMTGMFSHCSSLTSLDVSRFDTSWVFGFENMFNGCSSLQTIDVSNFVITAGDLSGMFYGCESLKSIDLSTWDTSAPSDLSYMFTFCSSLESVNMRGFNFSAVESMRSMFYNCDSLTAIPKGFSFGSDKCDVSQAFYWNHGESGELLDICYEGSDERILSYDWAADNRTLIVTGGTTDSGNPDNPDNPEVPPVVSLLPANDTMAQLTVCLLSDFNVGNGYEGKTVQDYIDSGAFVDRTIWTGLDQTYGELFSQVLGEYEIVSARAFAYRGAPHIALKHPTSGDVIIAFSEGGPELLESIGVPTYFNDATETLATIEDGYPSSTFYLTGSNAGGMAAAYLSSATHWKATTFNSPAVAATILTALTQPTTLSKTNAFNGVDDMGCVNYYTEGFEDRFGYSRGIAVSARVDANPLGEKDELTSFFEYGDVGYSLRSATLNVPGEMQMFGIQNIGEATETLFEKYEASILSLLDGKSLSDMFGFPSMTTIGDINTVLALGTTGHDSMRVGLFSGEESKDLLGHHVNMTGDASSDVMEGGTTSDVFVMGEGSATLSGRAGSDLYYIGNDALVTIHDTGATDGNNLIDLFRSSYKLVAAHDISAIPDFAESLGDVLSHTNRDAIIFTNCSFADMDVSYNTAGNYFIIQAGTSRVTVPNRSQDFYIVDASGQTVADGMMLNDLFALKRGVSKSSVNLMAEEATDYSQYVSFYIDGEDAAVRLVDVVTGQELRRITVCDATDMTDVCLDYGTFVVDGTGKTIDGLYDSSKIRVEIVGDSDQVITNNIVGTVEGDITVSENVVVSEYDDSKVEIRADDNVRLVGTKNGVEVIVPTTVVEDNATDEGAPDVSNPPSGGSGSGMPASPSFSPEITEIEHGSVTLTPSKPHEGDTVVITPKPDQGFVIGTVTVTRKDGSYVKVAESSDGTWVFMQPDGVVTVEVTFICNGGELCPSRHFLDVGQGTWYHEGVDWVVSAGIMNGYGDGSETFGPGDNLDRAQLAQVLWNKAGRPEPENPDAAASFVDTNPEAFYAKALAWCVENGYFMGYDKTHFGPSDDMTREQLATVLWRMEGSPEATADLSIFPDAADVSEFAYESIRWAVGVDAISGQGSDGKLDPVGTLGRGQCATILFRLYS